MQDGTVSRSLPSVSLVAATCVLAWLETGSIDASDWLFVRDFRGPPARARLPLGLGGSAESACGCRPRSPRRLCSAGRRSRPPGRPCLRSHATTRSSRSSTSPRPRPRCSPFVRASKASSSPGPSAFGTGGAWRSRPPSRLGLDRLPTYFVGDGRLAWPITYPNAAGGDVPGRALARPGAGGGAAAAGRRPRARARSCGRGPSRLADDPEQGRRSRARGLRGDRVRGRAEPPTTAGADRDRGCAGRAPSSSR